MSLRTLIIALFFLFSTSACGLIYKQNIQQGNALEQEDLDELYIGMNQRQVLFVLGTPSVKDPFNPDRWDYVQTFSRRGSDPVMRTVTLHFENGMLSEIEGQSDPFAPAGGDTGESEEVASFVKPKKESASPQEAALDSVEEEVLEGVDEDEEAIAERTEEDLEYQRDMEVLDQTPASDPSVPDIDG